MANALAPQALQTFAITIGTLPYFLVGAGLVSDLYDGSARAGSMENLRRLALIDTLTGRPRPGPLQ